LKEIFPRDMRGATASDRIRINVISAKCGKAAVVPESWRKGVFIFIAMCGKEALSGQWSAERNRRMQEVLLTASKYFTTCEWSIRARK